MSFLFRKAEDVTTISKSLTSVQTMRYVFLRRGFPQELWRKNLAGWFLKKIFHGGPYWISWMSLAADRRGEARNRNVWWPMHISLITAAHPHSSLHIGVVQTSLICTGRHTFRRRASPPREAANGIHWTLVRTPMEDFLTRIIRLTSFLGTPEATIPLRIRNAPYLQKVWKK
jgi:hypothetical protein